MSKKILVTGSSLVPQTVIAYLQHEGFEVVYHAKDMWTPIELHEALEGISGYLIGGYEEPTAEHFERASALEIVVWLGTDYKAYVPGWQRASELGIAFANTPGTNANSVAEFTLGLLIILLRKIGYRFETLRSEQPFAGSGIDLHNKTLGIIGMGRIGALVARIARLGFRMNVIYTNRTRYPGIESALDLQYMTKKELLCNADVISLHRAGLAKGESAELGAYEFSIMRKEAILINTAKWDLVDLHALYQALERKNLLAAAFDGAGVGEAWDRLTTLSWDQFIWFPQTGFNTSDANYRASMAAARAVVDVLRGASSPYVTNSDFREKRTKR